MGYIEDLRALVGTRALILTGVTVLVIDQNSRFLMVQSEKMWKLPGGFIELGESAEEACRREILEETGINIGNLQLIEAFFQGRTILRSCLMVINTFQSTLLTLPKKYSAEI
ncbi:NUDIX domain-containing protein [Bacillus sp. 445_BSPC]|uniref:NUDIX domain-containing protein n=1 Tax=Bacillus sp. 445_BSPC TaxID=1581712 RepID=UPI00069EEF0B|nr:NUDIX domain-containing protein [Bacillus sp. 445_BSPC]